MKKIRRGLSSPQRPSLFVTPLIPAHHKNPHRLAGKLIVYTFEQIVIPGERDRALVVLSRLGSEIDLTDLPSDSSVSANGHQQMLPVSGSLAATVVPYTLIVTK